MTGHHRLSEERRLEVVFEHKSGKSIRDIAKKLGINKNTVSNIIKKHKSTGSVKDLPGRGRKKSTTQRQDRRLIRRSLNDRRLTSSDLKKVWQEECGINVTSRTVRSRLNEAGLKGCVAVKKPLLSKRIARRGLIGLEPIKTGLFQTGAVFCGQMRVPLNSSIRLRGYL